MKLSSDTLNQALHEARVLGRIPDADRLQALEHENRKRRLLAQIDRLGRQREQAVAKLRALTE